MAVWSEVTASTIVFSRGRIDAEFYQPKYLMAHERIRNMNSIEFGEIISVLTDYHANGSYETLNNHVKLLDEPNYSYMVRTTDLENNNFETELKYVTKEAHDFLSKSIIFGQEILVNKIGSAGKVYLMPCLERPATLGMNLFLIRTCDLFDSGFVYAYLLSSYGKLLMERQVNGTVPLTITKNAVRDVLIPIFTNEEQNKISILITKHLIKQKESKENYSQAQELLETELGLDKLTFEKPIAYETSFSEVVNSHRIDADFYQLKYKQLDNLIRKFDTRKIQKISEKLETGQYSPYYSSNGVRYIRGVNVNSFGFIEKKNILQTSDLLPVRNNTVNSNDILVTRVGSIGVCGLIESELGNSIFSDNLLRIRINSDYVDVLSPYYLNLLLNTTYGKSQMIRYSRGSVQQRLNQTQLGQIPIPIISYSVQKDIESLLISHRKTLFSSEQLLEQAKTQVEQLVEQAVQS